MARCLMKSFLKPKIRNRTKRFEQVSSDAEEQKMEEKEFWLESVQRFLLEEDQDEE